MATRANVPAPSATFKLLSGTPKTYIKTAESGNKRMHAFCPDCGTPVYAANPVDPPAYSLRIGCLDRRAELAPKKQIWCQSAVGWSGDLGAVPKTMRQ